MRTKLVVTIFHIVPCICMSQAILVNNEEHLIFYVIHENILHVSVEDKRDNEFNIYYYNEYDPRGNEFSRCSTEIKAKKSLENTYARAYDNSLLEFDLNQNGKLEGDVDLGIHVNYRYRTKNTEAYTHKLTPKYELPYEREMQGYANNITTSKITSTVRWEISDSIKHNHVVYTYAIPMEELLLSGRTQISFRVVILRTAKIWHVDRPYGTFIYPNQSCEYGVENAFFSIALEELGSNQFAKRITEEKQLRNEKYKSFMADNDAYTNKKMLAASLKLPTGDGLSIKLSNGKLINVEGYPVKLGSILDNKSPTSTQLADVVKRNLRPYLTEESLLNTRFLRIKQDEFAGYYIVAANQLKNGVNNQSLHPMVSVVLEAGKLRVVNEPPSSAYAWGESITDQIVVSIQDRIPSLTVSPSDNFTYFIEPEFQLRPGFYMVWVGRNMWMFEIIG